MTNDEFPGGHQAVPGQLRACAPSKCVAYRSALPIAAIRGTATVLKATLLGEQIWSQLGYDLRRRGRGATCRGLER